MTKQGRMRGRCLVAIFVAIFGTSFVAKQTGVPPALASDRTFVQSAHDDQGPYYRFKLKLIYKGEKQDFDIIVGCKVPYDMYDSIYAGVVPTIFGRRMGDGKGLVIRVPRACDGQSLTGVGEDVSQYPQK